MISMRRQKMSVSCVLLVILLQLCSCDNTSSNSQTFDPQTAIPPTTPIQTATSQPALQPVPNGPTIMGGSISPFLAKYGTPTNQSNTSLGDYHFQQYPGSYADFLMVDTDLADGGVYEQRVVYILVTAPPNSPWNTPTANALCNSFAPQDAHYRKQIDVVNNGQIIGINKIYYSPSLAKDLPSKQFYDTQQNPVQTGLFGIQYYYSSDYLYNRSNSGPGIWEDCEFAAGTQ